MTYIDTFLTFLIIFLFSFLTITFALSVENIKTIRNYCIKNTSNYFEYNKCLSKSVDEINYIIIKENK